MFVPYTCIPTATPVVLLKVSTLPEVVCALVDRVSGAELPSEFACTISGGVYTVLVVAEREVNAPVDAVEAPIAQAFNPVLVKVPASVLFETTFRVLEVMLKP
jgi:hypothetical protein